MLSPRRLHRRNVAVSLYPDLAGSRRPELRELCETLLGRINTSNSTNKRTHSGRFAEFDRVLLGLVEEEFESEDPIKVLDLGVSDGRTAVELFGLLADKFGGRLDYVASDKYQVFRQVDLQDEPLSIVLDADDQLCQIIRPPFVLNVFRPESPLFYPVNRMLRLLWLPKAARLLRDWTEGTIQGKVSDVRLLHPACEDLLATDERFHFEPIDILEPIDRSASLVRIMNVLNPAYFSPEQALIALRHLSGCLASGGLLVIASNEGAGSEVHGGIYRKEGARTELLRKLGSGWGYDSLVAQI